MEWLVQFGIAGAVVAVVILFLRFLREERHETRLFLENHMAGQTAALKAILEQLVALRQTIHKCRGPTKDEGGA